MQPDPPEAWMRLLSFGDAPWQYGRSREHRLVYVPSGGLLAPVMGSLIFGAVMVGLGLGQVTGRYELIGALVLIAIGVGALLRGLLPR